jgi:hypothetical protein
MGLVGKGLGISGFGGGVCAGGGRGRRRTTHDARRTTGDWEIGRADEAVTRLVDPDMGQGNKLGSQSWSSFAVLPSHPELFGVLLW